MWWTENSREQPNLVLSEFESSRSLHAEFYFFPNLQINNRDQCFVLNTKNCEGKNNMTLLKYDIDMTASLKTL